MKPITKQLQVESRSTSTDAAPPLPSHSHRNIADHSEREITFRDIGLALEFCGWVLVGLVLFLRWVNGAAVTDDQYYFQCAIVVIAVATAVSLRLYNWRQRQSHRE